MKKVLALSLLLAFGINSYALIIAFRWGTYNGYGKGCEPGFGLCYIELLFKQPYNEQCNAEMVNGKLNIWIDEKFVPAEYKENIKNKAIKYNLDYIVDPKLCKELGVESYVIKKGSYAFSSENGKLHLVF